MSTTLPIPVFFDTDVQVIIDEMKTRYEELTGKTLYPGQVEQLLLNNWAYREELLRVQANEAAKQLLADFSNGPVLDYLARNVGIDARLEPAAAYCTIRFTLVDGHGLLVLPEGLRVQTSDGQKIFATKVATTVAPTVNQVDIDCICLDTGVSGNGYALNTVNVILDPQPYLTTATNITVTEGGSDAETDDQLRQRIFLAFAQSATAGSYSSYRFWTRSASPQIVDVFVAGPEMQIPNAPPPGHVHVYPLLGGGVPTPQEIIELVYNTLNAEDVRPLTDTVTVFPPEPIYYQLNVALTILTTAVQQLVVQTVQQKLNEFTAVRIAKLGLDITLDQITALCMVDGVYSVNITDPSNDLIVLPNQFAVCTGLTVTVANIVNG